MKHNHFLKVSLVLLTVFCIMFANGCFRNKFCIDGVINGAITVETGDAVASGVATVRGTTLSQEIGADGKFSIEKLPLGVFVVDVEVFDDRGALYVCSSDPVTISVDSMEQDVGTLSAHDIRTIVVSTKSLSDWHVTKWSNVTLTQDREALLISDFDLGSHGMCAVAPQGNLLKVKDFTLIFKVKSTAPGGWNNLGVQIHKPSVDSLYKQGGYWISVGNEIRCMEYQHLGGGGHFGESPVDIKTNFVNVKVDVEGNGARVYVENQLVFSFDMEHDLPEDYRYLQAGYITFMGHSATVELKDVRVICKD